MSCLVSGSFDASAFYPLSHLHQGRDLSKNRNPSGKLYNVRPAPGPDGLPLGSFHFTGIANSFIRFPKSRCLDAKRSLTIVVWVYPEGSGPILHYHPNSWGVHAWMASTSTVLVRFVPRNFRSVPTISSRGFKPNQWNYLAVSYNYNNGVATIWRNSVPVAQRRIGKFELATNYDAVMGIKRIGSSPAFKGRIACLHIYNRALNGKQIASLKRRCFRGEPASCICIPLNLIIIEDILICSQITF